MNMKWVGKTVRRLRRMRWAESYTEFVIFIAFFIMFIFGGMILGALVAG